MLQGFEELRRAGRVRTPVHGLAFVFHHGSPAHRAKFRHFENRPVLPARDGHRGDDVGDHVAGSLNDHGVSDANILAVNVSFVVERCVLHRRAAHHHRLQNRLGIKATRAPHVDDDVQQAGGSTLGGELVGDCPARFPARDSQRDLLSDAVNLHHYAVRFIIPLVPTFQHLVVEIANLVHRIQNPIQAVDAEPVRFQVLQTVPMTRRHGSNAGVIQAIHPHLHVSACRDFGVQLTYRARSGVAGVGIQRLTQPFAFFVHLAEAVQREINLAAHLQISWRPARQGQGYAPDGTQVVGNVFPGLTVAAGRTQQETSVPVG